jgi:hypothetical protein
MFNERPLAVAGTLFLAAFTQVAGAVEVAIDPSFEAAGVDGILVNPPPGPQPPGWIGFQSNGANEVGTTTDNPNSGTYAGVMRANAPSSNAVLKNANVGIGTAVQFVTVDISFRARGAGVDGGVAFAEFFSELAGGGVSKTEILGGGPLALDPDPNVWTEFNFTTTTGPDVSGGVTLQFAAVSGGAPTSLSEYFVDDISIDIDAAPVPAIPLPLGMWLFGSAIVGAAGWARRRQNG